MRELKWQASNSSYNRISYTKAEKYNFMCDATRILPPAYFVLHEQCPSQLLYS